jgi:hypothetical protein
MLNIINGLEGGIWWKICGIVRNNRECIKKEKIIFVAGWFLIKDDLINNIFII